MIDKELRLQPRLQCLADCVPQGTRLADVGTDHGYLPVWLLQNGRIASAIASDINAEPLEQGCAEVIVAPTHIEPHYEPHCDAGGSPEPHEKSGVPPDRPDYSGYKSGDEPDYGYFFKGKGKYCRCKGQY